MHKQTAPFRASALRATGVTETDRRVQEDMSKPTSKNTNDLARRLPNSELILYPDSGHGAVFQHHADFVPRALEFLAR